jgi:hypothetical protein
MRLLMRRSAILLVSLTAVTAASAAPGGSAAAGTAPCSGGVSLGVLPVWARGGFSDPKPKMPHVVGDGGAIAAVLFGDALMSPSPPDRSNKILWVARTTPEPPAQLTIQARQGNRTVTRKVDVGPSYVDLPAGCWHLDLSWTGGGHDSLDLAYTKP